MILFKKSGMEVSMISFRKLREEEKGAAALIGLFLFVIFILAAAYYGFFDLQEFTQELKSFIGGLINSLAGG